MPTHPKTDDFVEVYHTHETLVARRILDVILIPDGINAVLHDRTDKALPAAGQPGAVYVAVPMAHKDEALRLINEAVENGYLTADDGSTVDA